MEAARSSSRDALAEKDPTVRTAEGLSSPDSQDLTATEAEGAPYMGHVHGDLMEASVPQSETGIEVSLVAPAPSCRARLRGACDPVEGPSQDP